MRKCKKCEKFKSISDYYLKNNGKVKSSLCKECYNIEYKSKYDKSYYENNKEKFKERYSEWLRNNDRTDYMKNYREINSQEIKKKQKEFRENNKELVSQRKKTYWQNLSSDRKTEINESKKIAYHKNHDMNREKKNDYFNERVKNEPLFKLSKTVRCLIRNSIKRKFTSKSKKTIEILGCSFEEFKFYLESKFDQNMNWENQGTYWHLDHIIPISAAKSEEEVYGLNHYTNFQPLYWLDNLKKSNKIK
jgi:hypothetical protein